MKWVIAIALLLSLFLLFPKKMLGGLGVLVLMGSAIGGFFYYQDWSNKKINEAVSVTVSYSLADCDVSSPLKIMVENGSDKTITLVEWNISAHQVGFSGDLAVPGYQIYSQNKILKPSERWVGCVRLPKLVREVNALSQLLFSIKDKDVVFE